MQRAGPPLKSDQTHWRDHIWLIPEPGVMLQWRKKQCRKQIATTVLVPLCAGLFRTKCNETKPSAWRQLQSINAPALLWFIPIISAMSCAHLGAFYIVTALPAIRAVCVYVHIYIYIYTHIYISAFASWTVLLNHWKMFVGQCSDPYRSSSTVKSHHMQYSECACPDKSCTLICRCVCGNPPKSSEVYMLLWNKCCFCLPKYLSLHWVNTGMHSIIKEAAL